MTLTSHSGSPSNLTTLRRAVAASVAVAAVLLGCSSSVSVQDLKLDPDTANKGDTVPIQGKVQAFGKSINSVTISVTDDKGGKVDGISASSNAVAKDKTDWDLRKDGDAKVVTTAAVPSGKYKVKVEAKIDDKSDSQEVTLTIR